MVGSSREAPERNTNWTKHSGLLQRIFLVDARFPTAHVISGYAKPTPVQAQAWPIAMSGRDVVALADTGLRSVGACLSLFKSSRA